MKIVVAADPWGVDLKTAVKEHLVQRGQEAIDLGGTPDQPVDYYKAAATAAKMIQAGQADRAILCCGTGMGMAVVANKFKGICAGVVESELAARLSRAINNSNVLTMGGMILTPYEALRAVDAWLDTEHTAGFEQYKDFLCGALKAIADIEESTMK